jgi:translation initiation factor eIF-2B subunit epsilon
MSLKDALQEHKDRRKKDPLAIMTMIIKHSKPDILTNETRLGNDEIVMAINPETKELHCYEERVDSSRAYVTIDKDILASNPSLVLHNDMEVCFYTQYLSISQSYVSSNNICSSGLLY